MKIEEKETMKIALNHLQGLKNSKTHNDVICKSYKKNNNNVIGSSHWIWKHKPEVRTSDD